MKKLLALPLLIFSLFASKTDAAPVTETTAKLVAQNFYKQNTTKIATDITLAYTAIGARGNAIYYIFNVNENDGFVIVSADDAYIPVLGYNDRGHYSTFKPSPEFLSWMKLYAKKLDYIQQNNLKADSNIARQWNAYINGIRARHRIASTVLPLTNIIWNQSPFFNAMCPGGSVTGCCATAQAQIMKYWKYPLHGILSHSYNENTPQYQENYGVLSRNFYKDTFNWAGMTDTVNAPNAYVAQLMFDCGVGLDMNYSPGGSNAEVVAGDDNVVLCTDSVCNQTSYVRFFGYDRHTLQGMNKSNYTNTAWTSILENELNNGRLVQYAGGGDIGHTWVCEGYDANNYFYMNWGWGSADNGYFPLDSVQPGGDNFDSLQQMLIGIQPPAASAQFYASVPSVKQGSSVKFTDESLTPATITSWNWYFPGGTPATSTAQNPTVVYNTPGEYNVTLIVTATGGGDTVTRSNYIIVEPNNNYLPLVQGFESNSFPPDGWYINNPNEWTTSDDSYGNLWQKYSYPSGGGFGNSNSCMIFDNFNWALNAYMTNEPPYPNPLGGQRQQICTPAKDFTGIAVDSLYFDVAYAPYSSVNSDTLAVYYSLDCGKTWVNIYLKGGMKLATADSISANPSNVTGFFPQRSQWRTDIIQLPAAVLGQPSVMFSFENRSNWGGQLYVDNINIPGDNGLSSVNSINNNDGVSVYPNPGNGLFTISLTGEQNFSHVVEVYNVIGEILEKQCIASQQQTIDLSSQPNGVYLIKISGSGNNYETKVIVQH